MQLQPSERSTQLMRGVLEETLLHGVGVPQMAEQLIECSDDRSDLDRGRVLRERTQIAWRSGQQLAPQSGEWQQSPGYTEPGKRYRTETHERRGDELGDKNFGDQPVSLVQRLSDLHHNSRRRSQRSHADLFSVIFAIEEEVFPRNEFR